MADAKTSLSVLPRLLKVVERAQAHPEQRLLALAHLIDEDALARAYERLRIDAAVGVDGVTVEAYGERLAENLSGLWNRMKTGKPSSTDPTSPHPEGRRHKAADRDIDDGGQDRPGRGA